jgi:hypothetical protein
MKWWDKYGNEGKPRRGDLVGLVVDGRWRNAVYDPDLPGEVDLEADVDNWKPPSPWKKLGWTVRKWVGKR